MDNKKILFVGGGTVGHIYPILSVMEELQQLDTHHQFKLHYVGEKKDIDHQVIKSSQIAFQAHAIAAGKLNRFFTWKHLIQMSRFTKGTVQAQFLLKKIKPDLIFAKGGYVCVPIILAAKLQKIPVFCHETDVVLGLTNRLVANYAQKVFTAFPAGAYHQIDMHKLHYSGQPIRSDFYLQTKIEQLKIGDKTLKAGAKPIIAIVGGSQGAHNINKLVEQIWVKLLDKYRVVHLCGPNDYDWLDWERQKLSSSQQHNLYLERFFINLPSLFKMANLVISRSGGTIFELAASKVPTIIIPLSTAAQDHQNANASVLENRNAALVLREAPDLDANMLYEAIDNLLSNQNLQLQLAENIASLAQEKAALHIAQEIKKFILR